MSRTNELPPVLVTRRIPESVLRYLEEHCAVDVWEGPGAIPRDALLGRVAEMHGILALLTERIDNVLLDAAPHLRIVANFAVGLDNVDVPACSRRGVLVTNTPDVLTESTADMAWALMLAAARRVVEGDRFLRSRTAWIWGPEMMLGVDVYGKTLGVVGFGRIGQAVARRARGFGMRVVYHSRSRVAVGVEQELGAEYRDFDDLLSEADFVSVNTPLTAETHHLFGATQFARMKRTAILVNTARGSVLDEAALAGALRGRVILAAGLDVFEREPEVFSELLDLENVVLVPHLGSATVETREAMGMLAARNLVAALEGGRPPTLVNPEALHGG